MCSQSMYAFRSSVMYLLIAVVLKLLMSVCMSLTRSLVMHVALSFFSVVISVFLYVLHQFVIIILIVFCRCPWLSFFVITFSCPVAFSRFVCLFRSLCMSLVIYVCVLSLLRHFYRSFSRSGHMCYRVMPVFSVYFLMCVCFFIIHLCISLFRCVMLSVWPSFVSAFR